LHHQVANDADFPLAIVPCPVNLLDPNADRDKLIALMRDAAEACGKPVVLVVIDTLSRAMAGGNENAPEDMTGFIQNVDVIRAAFGAHTMIVHHAGKDIARGARGHNSLRAATDTEIEIARVDGGENKLAFARVTKQRDMPGDDVFHFCLKAVELGLDDEEGQIVTSAVVVPAEPALPEPKEPLRRMKDMPALRLDKLTDLIAQRGERVNAPDHIPDDVLVTTIEAWKDALTDGGLLDGETPDARRMQFNRTREALLKAGAIGIWKNYIWTVRD
jgi:hypothetical protein